jgi:cytochrome b subunit of formate dehydrogenase
VSFIQWAISPWGERVPTHISWDLIWVAVALGVIFLVGHAIYVGFIAKAEPAAPLDSKQAAAAARVPARVARHSFGARAFHWVMAGAMFVLVFSAFLPKVGYQFDWVKMHWIAGVVLTISVIYHILHATFVLDFWSIWPDSQDIADASNRMKRARGQSAAAPIRAGKYPLENKLFHLIVLLAGLSVIITGVFMMYRVRTPFFTRNPYLFGDMTWGLMYVLHGLAGVGFVTLIMAHIYFAIRPEKFFLTKSMFIGWISKEKFLEHHDPERWLVEGGSSKAGQSKAREVTT